MSSYVEVLTPHTTEGDLVGNRVAAVAISLDEVILERHEVFLQCDWCLRKKRDI